MKEEIVPGLPQLQKENGEWFPASAFLGCCDCGLIHRMDYQMVDGVLLVRAVRDEELTKRAREERSFFCSIQRRGNDD